jgi:hypothetical protein
LKGYLLCCNLILLCCFNAQAQFTSGADGFYISASTHVAFDGLTFQPAASFSIQNNSLTISPVALPGSPPSITRVYLFDAPVTFVGQLGQFYLTSELNGNTETMLQLVYKNATPVTTAGSVVNTTSHYIYNDLIAPATFSAITAAQPGALPVTLLKFTAKKEGSGADLNWSTTSELNSDYFEVQHSSNAKEWNTLARITAANRSSDLKNYGFSHGSTSAGTNYYRLKIVDKDQSYAYSTIRALYIAHSYQLSLYPNPTVEKVRITMDQWEKIAAVKLLNESGHTLFETHKKPFSKEINMKDLPAGLYIVQLQLNDGSTTATKVIKQ